MNKQDIRLMLDRVPNIDNSAKLSYHYLSNGITNDNYKIILNNHEYVLRINNPNAKSLGIDHLSELLILDRVTDLDISVKPFYTNTESSFRLSHWQRGQTWDTDCLKKPIQLNRLAERLKQLHKIPTHGLPLLDLIQKVDCYRTAIINQRGKFASLEANLLNKAIKLISSIQYSMPSCLCHNDLLVVNILEAKTTTTGNSHILFLDWEYAAVGHPLFELAVICRGNNISQTNKEYLLSAYHASATFDGVSEEFEQWCWLYDYLSFLWGLAMLPIDIPLPENIDHLLEQLIISLPNK